MIPAKPDVPAVLAVLVPERVPHVVPSVFELVVLQSIAEPSTSNDPRTVPEIFSEIQLFSLRPRLDEEYVIGLASPFVELGKAKPVLKKKKASKKIKKSEVCHRILMLK